jgi:universal stress protein A
MNQTFNQILVAVDFSPSSAQALDFAHVLARRFGARLRAVHVIEVPLPVGNEVHAAAIDMFHRRLVADGRRLLLDVVAHIDDVALDTDVLVGEAAHCIARSAADCGADLIVTGSRTQASVARFLTGSVAQAVMRLATCTVVAVGDHADDHEAARSADIRVA